MEENRGKYVGNEPTVSEKVNLEGMKTEEQITRSTDDVSNPTGTKKEKKVEKPLKVILSYLSIFVITFCIMSLVRIYVLSPTIVSGESMYPTLHDKDKVFLNKLIPMTKGYDRFDIIVFKHAEDDYYIKRIIGLPGDNVSYKDDKLYINGKYYEEPYLEKSKTALSADETFTYDFSLDDLYGLHKIPDGEYLVLGDNRRNSNDSRNAEDVGLIPESKMLGKTTAIFYPLKDARLITKP